MRILLVNPPNCGRSIPEERYGLTSIKQIFRGEPLALEVLAGNLAGHEVALVDLKVDPAGLEPALASFRPELVGITAVTCEANTARSIAAAVKKSCGATVAVGGIHASNDPEFFNVAVVDFVVVGLGKASFRELVDALERGEQQPDVPGVAATAPGKPLRYVPRSFGPADLGETNPPRYDLTADLRRHYTLLGHPMGFVASAFGCPFDCNFCCIAGQAGGRYLSCAVATVLRDIRLLGAVPIIRLVDANTFGNVEHARSLCTAIAAAGLNKQFLADVRSDTVVRHPELLRQWHAAGLRTVVIGFEEISDSSLEGMNKANREAVNREAIAILREIGITIVGDFIVSPDYDHADFDALIAYLQANPVDLPIFTVMTPLPGTALHRAWKERIVNFDLDYYTLSNAVVPTRLDEGEFYRRYAELFQLTHPKAKI
jgi:hopanoid C-3 methylase